MNFDILMQKDFKVEDAKNCDAIKFLRELGADTVEALETYYRKCVITLAKQKDVFAMADDMVLYVEEGEGDNRLVSSIVVRKAFEKKIVRLNIDLEKQEVTLFAESNGAKKNKAYEPSTKIVDILKDFNAFLKAIQK